MYDNFHAIARCAIHESHRICFNHLTFMSCDVMSCITDDVNHEAINNQFKIIFVLIRLCNRLKKLHLKAHKNPEKRE